MATIPLLDKSIIAEFEKDQKLNKKDSKFIKLKNGESALLRAVSAELVQNNFNPKEKTLNVTVLDSDNKEKTFSLNRPHWQRFREAGLQTNDQFEVRRVGEGKDTRYYFTRLNDIKPETTVETEETVEE